VRWIALRWGIDLCYRGIDGMRDILERLKLERRITVIIIAAYVILALALNVFGPANGSTESQNEPAEIEAAP